MPYFYETAQKSNGPEILGQFATKYLAFFGLIALFTLVIARPLVLIMADQDLSQADCLQSLLSIYQQSSLFMATS